MLLTKIITCVHNGNHIKEKKILIIYNKTDGIYISDKSFIYGCYIWVWKFTEEVSFKNSYYF